MSHFSVLVIVPTASQRVDIVERVTALLAPFDEALQDEVGAFNTKTSKWDWWQFGGRWHGLLTGKELPDDAPFDAHYKVGLEDNFCPVAALLFERDAKKETYAVVTPDGAWHEKGTMGWFGISKDEKEPNLWSKEFWAVLSDYSEHTAVLVDCHM